MNIVTAVRDLGRLREISVVLVRHGFGEIVARAGFGRVRRNAVADGTSSPPLSADGDALATIADDEKARGEEEKKRISVAERVRLVLQDLGPSFIKLGQIASTRTDVLPPEVIAELKKLQDEVPPVPYDDIRRVIEDSLGARPEDIFVSIDQKPLATASIGQVHRAVLAVTDESGTHEEQVVVKVQRPNVGPTVARDLEILHFMAAAVERAIPETRLYSPVGLVQNFDRSITSELNFLVEADNAERFAKNFEGRPGIRFPKVYRQATSKHVLTLEFFEGRKVDKAVKEGFDGKRIAKISTAVVIKMIFEDGFFHADPHPGNVIIMGTPEDPVVGLIDLGMVGRLSPELRDLSVDLMMASVRNDTYAVADALYAIGRPTKKIDMRAYRAEVSTLAEKYLGRPFKEIDLSGMIRDIVNGAIKFGLEVPTDFMLVGKSLMTMEVVGKELDPDLDVFGEAAPHFTAILKQRYSPQRLGNELIRGVGQLSRAGYDVPMQLREVLDDLRLGRLALRTVDPELPRAYDRFGRRVYSGLIVGSLIGGGSLVVARGGHDPVAIVLYVLAALVWLGHAVLDLRRGPRNTP